VGWSPAREEDEKKSLYRISLENAQLLTFEGDPRLGPRSRLDLPMPTSTKWKKKMLRTTETKSESYCCMISSTTLPCSPDGQ
jgi:hypothetical protein